MLVGLLQFAAATAFSPRPAQCPVGEPIVGPCTVEPFECPVGEPHVGCVLPQLSRTLTNVVPNVTIGSHTFSGNPCKNYPGYPRTRNPIHHYTNALTGSCELVDDLTDWEIPQTAIDVTKGTQGLIKPDLDPKPLHKAIGPGKGCVVNIHYHLGTEHYNADSYSENGPEFLERALGCVPANYEGMDGYDPTKDTVFCCENYDHNHLAFEDEFGREGGDRLLPEVWKKMKAAFCHGESKPKCCTGNALYSNDMFSDKPIFTEQELGPQRKNDTLTFPRVRDWEGTYAFASILSHACSFASNRVHRGLSGYFSPRCAAPQ
ncbi:hypothetical protein EMIHUDRAFT_195575 [Emiliania huxleyi CCMP1516]|uniref:Uncharacterized protein n=2 Tax=Emiliania huxleyi TaxID=2903 RepID=A0A0D3JHQ5_EMIH1|nr:hypothetical protein EMIHUDRAFT_195575 [Emiliania huxleyi CCMP1516]EOD23040.1 hypothetical protein EMIHUDRAFT_195575 [Emiliania huxleyi CCMP1516]|eukprot:XP_005775469.1 hypothetical protein EMIHUDRAFT_195575 [Emiliania huxleyi CCMP1516]